MLLKVLKRGWGSNMNFGSLNLKWCADLHNTNSSIVSKHNHTFFQVLYIKSGTGFLKINNKAYDLNEGDFYIFKPLENHEFHATSESLNTLEAKFDVLDNELNNELSALDNFIPVKKIYFERIFTDLIYEYTNGGEFSEDVIKSIFTEFIIHLLRSNNKRDAKSVSKNPFLAVTNYIEKHHREDLKLENLAAIMHMEKSYFLRQFKKNIGKTPMAYVNRVKIDRAKDLIENSDMNITQISEFLGYSSIHHFSNSFKKITGISPKQYIYSLKH